MLISETERLTLRPYVEDDVGFVFDLYSRWEVMRFLGPAPKAMQSTDEARAAIERWWAASDPDRLLGHWAVIQRASGDLVGTVVLEFPPLSAATEPLPLSDDLEIGWHLHPRYWGKGYATEAARGVLDRVFAAGAPEVIALVHPDNEASKRVAGRLGMEYMGKSRRYYSVEAELYRATRPPK
jgi:RimJ/RimL family protein N-acetyltransferase